MRALAMALCLAFAALPAVAQNSDPFRSAPPPAPKPVPHPAPPAEPAPATTPAPSASLRPPDGALTGDQIRQLSSGNTFVGGNPWGSKWDVYSAPDGQLWQKGTDPGGRPISDHGHWTIENNMSCTQWDHFFFGKKGCHYLLKTADGYETRNIDGSLNATFSIQPGNVKHLP